ncbi:NAD(P)/FAD-dependent oxidoreductase [Candidatus Woesearchaeota archaeon]|nr:NAD(P)/FAD-dependent oxidoreductase [Candidatus Woesearchaeota archaeon]
MKKQTILIIGGGFGGVYTARYLLQQLNSNDATITLINPKNYFLFAPMLHEVATGGLNRYTIVTPIRDILDGKNFRFILGKASKVDLKKKAVAVNGMAIPYDYLVLAQGSHADMPSIPGAQKNCLCLKTINDAARIRDHAIRMLEQAAKSPSRKEQEKCLTFILIGGGPTGVELAGELSQFVYENVETEYRQLSADLVSIYLVHSRDKLVPVLFHDPSIEKCRKELERKKVKILLNSRAASVKDDCVEILDTTTRTTKMLYGNTLIWTAGVAPNSIPGTEHCTDKKGSLLVDGNLRVKNAKGAYALGDCALSFNPGSDKQNPATAQLATRQAGVVAKNIIASIQRKPLKTFVFKPQGFLVSVGEYYAVAEVKGIWFSGLFAWWMWRTIYLAKLIGWTNRIRVATDWTINLLFKRDTTQIDGEE